MEFLNYRAINAKLKKRGILYKKPSVEDASTQFYLLARQLEEFKLYSGFCHLAISNCLGKIGQTSAFLNAARSFSQADEEVMSSEDHIKSVIWVYTEALLICDRSFIKPIRLEMGRFYESHKMYQQAAECFKQSMSISRCVNNLILAEKYSSALDELKNCPSHLMTTRDHTSMFLLELLLTEDPDEFIKNSLQHLSSICMMSTENGPFPVDDHLFDLTGLLESLYISLQDDKKRSPKRTGRKSSKITESIVEKLGAFLDPAQILLLDQIISNRNIKEAKLS